MHSKSLIIVLLFLGLYGISVSQNSENDTINKTDSQGKKQGKWVRYHENTGKIRYTGQFKDDKPIGVFKHYYDSGELQARLIYHHNGINASANLFHKNGKKMAVGYYTHMHRDSTWLFFNEKEELVAKEQYVDTLKEGVWIVYNVVKDTIAEIVTYKNDKKNGKSKTYFDNGQVETIVTFKDGKENGFFEVYYEHGTKYILGAYKNGLRFGKWYFFDERGYEKYTVEYDAKGELTNKEEIEELVQEQFKEMEKKAKEYEQNRNNKKNPFYNE